MVGFAQAPQLSEQSYIGLLFNCMVSTIKGSMIYERSLTGLWAVLLK